MAMKRSFYTVDGKIIGEGTSGGEINYATDALGSGTGTLIGDQLVNTYAYKPYGALLAKTGAGADPKLQWVGSLGYRATGRRRSESYGRTRHDGSMTGIWTSADPLWPVEPAHPYARASATTNADSYGLQAAIPIIPEPAPCPYSVPGGN